MPSNVPTLRFSTTTRGNGKVFTLLQTKVSVAMWETSSETLAGKPTPSKVCILDSGDSVLVVPALRVSQRVELTARNEMGEVVARGSRIVNHLETALTSKKNTLLKNPRVNAIRNCDQNAATNEIAVYALRLIPKGTDLDLLHALVFFAVVDPAQEPPVVSFEVLDQHGHSIMLDEPILLGNDIEEFPDYPGVYYRAAQYSIPVKQDTNWFCLIASCPETGLAPNFVCMQPHDMFGLLNLWHTIPFGFEGADPNYETWFNTTRASEADLEVQRRDQRCLAIRPKFSIVVPLYHTPISFFHDMAKSVLEQTYPNWELILVNSTPEDEDLTAAVREFAGQDDRIVVVTLDKNYGITENTNFGISVATGDFVSFFDHDDLLEPDLLYWYVRGINDYPNTDMLYCDEDKLLDGHYIEPFYKPDWDVLFLETNNYICHLLTVRKSIIDSLPRPTDVYDGAQDHRLALAAGEMARNIYHVRRMLYHWRIHSASTAGDGAAKPESLTAGRRAIEEHLARLGIAAHVDDLPNSPHCYVPIYEVSELPRLSAIIAPGDSSEVERTVRSLEMLGWNELQVITAKPASIRQEVSNKLADAIAAATGDYLLLFRPGSVIRNASSLKQLLGCAMRPDVAIACPKMVFPDGTNYDNGLSFHERDILHMNRYFQEDLNADRAITVLQHEVSSGGGNCLALSREIYDAIGGITLNLSEELWGVDLCLKAHTKGMRVAQHSPSRIECRFTRNELTLNINRSNFESESARSYLLREYPEVLCTPDHFYKPLL